MRKAMIKNAQELQKDLKSQDPEGKFSSKLVNQARQDEIKYKIEELQAEKKRLAASLLINPNPVLKVITLKKISDIDKEIANLKKQSQ